MAALLAAHNAKKPNIFIKLRNSRLQSIALKCDLTELINCRRQLRKWNLFVIHISDNCFKLNWTSGMGGGVSVCHSLNKSQLASDGEKM